MGKDVNASAIVVAAGRGTRMGGIDKLFIKVADLPIIAHTVFKFEHCAKINEIIIVIRQQQEPLYAELLNRLNLKKPCKLTIGGQARQDSVWNGLNAASGKIVAIHDGARPCVPVSLIEKVIDAAIAYGAAVAAKKMVDTVKESDDGVHISRNIDRNKLWMVQTPQCFKMDIISKAIQMAKSNNLELTDDTAACELIGQPVRLVEYLEPNPKLTVSSDLPYIEFLLKNQS